ncbi:MAG: NAD(P)H-dependent oxidoreductase [Candidatus Omnitrophica bacterium]|nr:NAD(P)H-dependent oxidoreductase [Candidatus Omnitrophota bacterium]
MIVKISIVYFSLSGRTKLLSQSLAEFLRAEGFSVMINPLKSPSTGNFLKNCIDAFTKKKVKLEYIPEIKHSDVVFLGSPVWVFDITPAMRTFLENVNLKNKRVFLYTTYGSGRGKDRAMSNFSHIVELKGGMIIGKTDIKGRQVEKDFEKFKEIVAQCLEQYQLIKHPGR